MKNWISLCLALILSLGVLMYASADVNGGHGPGYVASEEEGGGH